MTRKLSADYDKGDMGDSPAFTDLRQKVKSLKIEDFFHFTMSGSGRRFRVKKLNQKTYHLKDMEITQRSRFRDGLVGIMEDLATVLETEHLPSPARRGW